MEIFNSLLISLFKSPLDKQNNTCFSLSLNGTIDPIELELEILQLQLWLKKIGGGGKTNDEQSSQAICFQVQIKLK